MFVAGARLRLAQPLREEAVVSYQGRRGVAITQRASSPSTRAARGPRSNEVSFAIMP
jgi:hypothetical protein